MDTNKIIGISLVLVAALLIVFATPALASIPILQTDGKQVVCSVTFDKDSINAFNCNAQKTCRVGLPFFLGIGDQTTEVRMLYSGISYADQKYTTNFGFDQSQTLQGCVPTAAKSVSLQVVDDQGIVKDSKEAALQ